MASKADNKTDTKAETKTDTKASRKTTETPEVSRKTTETPEAVQAGEVGPRVDALHAFLEANTKFKASDEEVASHYGPATRAAIQEWQAKMSKDGTWDGKVDGEMSPTFLAAVDAANA